MNKVYREIFPEVQRQLSAWKREAMLIPDEELRMQAIASIENKDFHCEGGAILALLAEDYKNEAISFIVAYQTISDYLDNLCDRSTSLYDKDFEALHEAMFHSLQRQSETVNYYRFREEQNDGGYLNKLVETCRLFMKKLNRFDYIEPYLQELCTYYVDLQIHKHVAVHEREDRLKRWFSNHEDKLPNMSWFEFSACSGSTLGIFCLISSALRQDFDQKQAEQIYRGYFPYIQGLHIMLDYFIDQQEDIEGGDLNFCFYYKNRVELYTRMSHFVTKAEHYLQELPHKAFHKLIHSGLLGLYLSDEKVGLEKETKLLAKKMVKLGGAQSRFFYMNAKLYRMIKKLIPSRFVISGVKS